MPVEDLRWPAQAGSTIRPVAGPGSDAPALAFRLWRCRVCPADPLSLRPALGTKEQVLFVTAGRGRLQLDAGTAELSPLHAHRLPDGAAGVLVCDAPPPLELLYFASPHAAPGAAPGTVDVAALAGNRFPARRWGRSITNGSSPLAAAGFTAGLSILAPMGGQVPWHEHPDRQGEVYVLLGGRPQVCIGSWVDEVDTPAAAIIGGDQWHQVTNLHPGEPLSLIYCYEGSVAAPHWWQERDGVLPAAGTGASPPLPAGAFPQCTSTKPTAWLELAAAHLEASARQQRP